MSAKWLLILGQQTWRSFDEWVIEMFAVFLWIMSAATKVNISKSYRSLAITKGQMILKGLFGILGFFSREKDYFHSGVFPHFQAFVVSSAFSARSGKKSSNIHLLQNSHSMRNFSCPKNRIIQGLGVFAEI